MITAGFEVRENANDEELEALIAALNLRLSYLRTNRNRIDYVRAQLAKINATIAALEAQRRDLEDVLSVTDEDIDALLDRKAELIDARRNLKITSKLEALDELKAKLAAMGLTIDDLLTSQGASQEAAKEAV